MILITRNLGVPNRKYKRDYRTDKSKERASEDAELVGRFKNGDETVFNEIVEKYKKKVFDIAFRMVQNRGDAEEITQDTFIKVHNGLMKFRGDSSFCTWLHRIVLNLSRNCYWFWYRRSRHCTFSLSAQVDECKPETFSDFIRDGRYAPNDEMIFNEFKFLVNVSTKRLSKRHREIIILWFVSRKSYEEISSILGISVGTVKSCLARSRAALLKQLLNMYPEFFENESVVLFSRKFNN